MHPAVLVCVECLVLSRLRVEPARGPLWPSNVYAFATAAALLADVFDAASRKSTRVAWAHVRAALLVACTFSPPVLVGAAVGAACTRTAWPRALHWACMLIAAWRAVLRGRLELLVPFALVPRGSAAALAWLFAVVHVL